MVWDERVLSCPASYQLVFGMTAEEIWKEARSQGRFLTTYLRKLWYERYVGELPDDVLGGWISHIRETCRELGIDLEEHRCPVCGRPLPVMEL